MSHIRIPRKQSQSPRVKIHSEESKPHKYSIQRIVHESIAKRRFSTQNNSFNKLEKSNSKEISKLKEKQNHSAITLTSVVRSEIEEAKKAFKTKNTKKALPLFKKVYEKHPAIPDIPYFIGSCLLNQGKLEAALNYFHTTLHLDPHYDRNIYIYIAICYKGLDKIHESLEALATATLKYPRFEQAYFYKAKMHMKVGHTLEAIHSLRKCCSLNPNNQLTYILLADNLKKAEKFKQSLEKYDMALSLGGQHTNIAILHKMQAVEELSDFASLQKMILNVKKLEINFPENFYYEGLIQYHKGQYQQAAILFEMGLKQNLSKNYLGKIMKSLVEIAVIEKDCFGAQHLMVRARSMGLEDKELQIYYDLVEGINDLIKRKFNESKQKLQRVYDRMKKKRNKFLYEIVLPYLGYCFFQMNEIEQALEIYKEYLLIVNPIFPTLTEQFNLHLCEGILLHKNKKYDKAETKFNAASLLLQEKIEPLFFKCINQIQKLKLLKQDPQFRSITIVKVEKIFQRVSHFSTKNSLFLFYESLVRLYENLDGSDTIQQAIDSADEQVSEYFFIHALSHAIKGEVLKGLQSMNKAIQIDQNIPQFFKERSKYFYILERYEESVEDIMKVLLDNEQDQEAKLLLTFYYYLTGQYLLSLQLLKELTESTGSHTEQDDNKFTQFEQALHFRLEIYQNCGIVGQIIEHIINREKIEQKILSNFLDEISNRASYSEFSIYFMYILLSSYYLYVTIQVQADPSQIGSRFQTAIDCLFGALQQINYHTEGDTKSKDEFSPMIQAMLSEVKFNIIVANLLRLSYHGSHPSKQKEQLYAETIKFINIFISETEDLDFIQCMKNLLEYLSDEKSSPIYNLQLSTQSKKVSDNFPLLSIVLSENKIIETKILIFYPQKLKFNIAPEFDESFLFNFDIDKIQSKLLPPWYKIQSQNGGLIFTDNIRNQSVMLSQTQKSGTPLLRPPSPIQQTLKERFKLDESVERKLNKLIKRH